jgi:hypothetical protein
MKTKLRPHKVLDKTSQESDVYSLVLTEGPFEGIIFSYSDVSFDEQQDEMKMSFEYNVHHTPDHRRGYDQIAFEKELGDFMVELLYYGLEQDKLGYIDDSKTREDDSIKFDSQRGVLP